MPQKTKIEKQDIILAALDIVRKDGMAALNAREVAKRLQCSTQPIFSNFDSMETLKMAVIEKGMDIYRSYLCSEREAERYPAYKASGMGYIRLAREEPQLFSLLFMRDRQSEVMPQEDTSLTVIFEILQRSLGLSVEQAKLFHLETWVFVHGIASMIATGYLDWDEETVSHVMTDMYQGLVMRFKEKEKV